MQDPAGTLASDIKLQRQLHYLQNKCDELTSVFWFDTNQRECDSKDFVKLVF